MNKEKRNQLRSCSEELSKVVDMFSELNFKSKLSKIRDTINEVKNKEEDDFNNLPESLQYSLKGNDMEDGISDLEDLIDSFDNVIEDISQIIEDLQTLNEDTKTKILTL